MCLLTTEKTEANLQNTVQKITFPTKFNYTQINIQIFTLMKRGEKTVINTSLKQWAKLLQTG